MHSFVIGVVGAAAIVSLAAHANALTFSQVDIAVSLFDESGVAFETANLISVSSFSLSADTDGGLAEANLSGNIFIFDTYTAITINAEASGYEFFELDFSAFFDLPALIGSRWRSEGIPYAILSEGVLTPSLDPAGTDPGQIIPGFDDSFTVPFTPDGGLLPGTFKISVNQSLDQGSDTNAVSWTLLLPQIPTPSTSAALIGTGLLLSRRRRH